MSLHRAWCAALFVGVCSGNASAQVPVEKDRDSLLNGVLIGAGAGTAAAFALDSLLCEAEGGRCDFPWAAYLALGGIGAGAGAGIDFLIGRRANGTARTIRVSPIISSTRRGVRASLALPGSGSVPAVPRGRAGRGNHRARTAEPLTPLDLVNP